MNSVNLIGRLGADIDIRYAESGTAIARFRLAVDRITKGKKDTDWINCTAFGNQAENANKYLRKGSTCGVSGSIKTGSYEKQDGTKVKTFEVWANHIQFLDSKEERPAEQGRFEQSYNNGELGNNPQGFQPVDDIPF